MAGFLGEDQVRKVKEAVDIVQLMGEYAPVRKAGRNFSCCCPFHQERSPSCYVYPDTQSYYCFGCGVHGDAISLVKEKENLSFGDAVEVLARRAGIQLVRDEASTRQRGEHERLIAACTFACRFYERQLWESPAAQGARDYLASRKLSRAVCERFRLGWAPGNGQLVAAARQAGIPADLLAALDLALERNGSLTDRFFERVTFPIGDRFGNPIAFSARLLPAAEKAAKEAGRSVGKYVNNTDTPLYHKGASVFNLANARTAARDRARLIVMEGPTDVMAADQAGIHECVAVLGTALTPEHAKLLGSLVGDKGQLVLLLDGDRAGQTNALKGVRTCLAAGVPVRVAILPDELDPAELLAEGGSPEALAVFERVVASARPDVDHLLRALAPRPYDLERRELVAVVDEVLAALRPLPDRELKQLLLQDVAEYFNLDREPLARRLSEGGEIKKPQKSAEIDESEPEVQDQGPPPLPALDRHQEVLLHILTARPELRATAADDLGLEPAHLPSPWSELAAALLLAPEDQPQPVLDPELHPGLGSALARWRAVPLDIHAGLSAETAAETLAACVRSLRLARCRHDLASVKARISEAERDRRFKDIPVLLNEQRDALAELKRLEGGGSG